MGGAWPGTSRPSAPTTPPLAAAAPTRRPTTTPQHPTSTMRRWVLGAAQWAAGAAGGHQRCLLRLGSGAGDCVGLLLPAPAAPPSLLLQTRPCLPASPLPLSLPCRSVCARTSPSGCATCAIQSALMAGDSITSRWVLPGCLACLLACLPRPAAHPPACLPCVSACLPLAGSKRQATHPQLQIVHEHPCQPPARLTSHHALSLPPLPAAAAACCVPCRGMRGGGSTSTWTPLCP